jgi:NADH-quinone oxidoreductase subunit E
MTDADHQALMDIVGSGPAEPGRLLPLLLDVQARFRHLPKQALEALSRRLGIPLPGVFAVASFYKALSLTPKGERVLTVCQGTACHLRGAPALASALEGAVGAPVGGTSPDGRHGLEAVNCLGACALAPVVMVDGEVHGHLTPERARALVRAPSEGPAE